MQDSLGPGGTLNTDSMARALLSHRNTPDSLTGISPAQVIFGRVLRDFLPVSPGRYLPRAEWRLSLENREIAHAKRHVRTQEALSAKSRLLSDLSVGDTVSVQDQVGTTPRRWSKTGTVVEIMGHDAYLVKMDGSNRLSKRNRQFLRRLTPYKCDVDEFTIPTVDPDLHVQAPDSLVDVPVPQQSPDPQSLSPSGQATKSVESDPHDSISLLPATDTSKVPQLSPTPPQSDLLVDSPHLPAPGNNAQNKSSPDSCSEPAKNSPSLVKSLVKERWVVNPKFLSSDSLSLRK